MKNRFDDKLREGHQIIIDFSHGNCVLRVITALEIKKAISKMKNPKILEIGCGEGIFTEYVFKYNPGIKLEMLDISPEMIRGAKKKLAKYEKNIKFFFADAVEFLGNTQEKYDLVFSSWTIHNFQWKDKIEFFKNVYQRLNKNGRLFLLDKIYPDNVQERNYQMKVLLARYENYLEPDLAREIISHSRQDFIKNYRMDEGKLIGTLKNIGFRDVKIFDREVNEAILTASR